VSIGFESLFIHHGLNGMDEGWPLHAAMELLEGKTLYDEVFWVFPPGHLLPAWIAYGLDSPGLILARTIYAAFGVALCVGLYFVARRLMPPDFALLAALLVAVAAPASHQAHLLFGYRYLAWSTIVLLFFHLRLGRDESRWLFPAGVFAGIALIFRLTPAIAVSAAVAVGVVAASRDWRRWLHDGLWYGAGFTLVLLPTLVWFHGTVGLEKLWIEVVVRPLEMTALQSRPLPQIVMPSLGRTSISLAFAAFGFRFYLLLYFFFLLALLYQWGRALLRRRPFENVFLLTFVLFGAIYFSRSMGRSDIPHLDSAVPPVAVLLAYCASLSTRLPALRSESSGRDARPVILRWAICLSVFGVWVFLQGADRPLFEHGEYMGDQVLKSVSRTIEVHPNSFETNTDEVVRLIQKRSRPGDTLLVMTHAPLVYVLANRRSPGYFDVIMPGTFRSRDEEIAFLERIEAAPPDVVVWPRLHFDYREDRGLRYSAPELAQWIYDNYRVAASLPFYLVLVPTEGVDADASAPEAAGE